MLQVGIHRPPQVDDYVFRNPADQHLLQEVGSVIHRHNAGKNSNDAAERGNCAGRRPQRMINGIQDDQGYRQLRADEHQHCQQCLQHRSPIRPDKGEKSPHDSPVKDTTKHLFVMTDLGTDHGPRWPCSGSRPRHVRRQLHAGET